VIVLLYLLIDERRRFGRFIKWRDGASFEVRCQDPRLRVETHSVRN
jgi:hypothetical protein